jgi:hypothetical protein
VWCPARKDTVIPLIIGRPFESIQRIAAQAIIGVIQTTDLSIVETEAGIESTYIRLRARIIKLWINCHTLPKDHAFWPCRAAAVAQDGSYSSPFKILAVHGPQCLADMEVIRPFPLDPLQKSLCELISSRGSVLDDLHETSWPGFGYILGPACAMAYSERAWLSALAKSVSPHRAGPLAATLCLTPTTPSLGPF